MLFDDGLYIERPISADPDIAAALAALVPISACLDVAPEFAPIEASRSGGSDPRMVAALIDRRESAARLVHKLLYGPLPPYRES